MSEDLRSHSPARSRGSARPSTQKARVHSRDHSQVTRRLAEFVGLLESRLSFRVGCRLDGHWGEPRLAHSAEMGFSVGADVGEASGIGHERGLAGFGVGPTFALLEFHGAVVAQFIAGHGGETAPSTAL